MNTITGIHTVELKLNANGHGVVNWNGKNPDSKYDNHLIPKLRKNKKNGSQHVYVSSNCTRHHLFKDEARVLAGEKARTLKSKVTPGNSTLQALIRNTLASSVGLIRGYMHTAGKNQESFGRKSPLLVEDLKELNSEETEEEICTSTWAVNKDGKRDSNSLFYRHSLGETAYEGHAAIIIEDLQFIPLDDTLGNSAYPLDSKKGKGQVKELVQSINHYLKTLSEKLNHSVSETPEVTSGHFKRKNNLLKNSEFGLLLNNSAIDLLVIDTIRRFDELQIIQGKGYLQMSSVDILLNDSCRAMAIKSLGEADPGLTTLQEVILTSDKIREYAIFFEPVTYEE